MPAPDGLTAGDTYIDNGLEFAIVEVIGGLQQYTVRLVGVASIYVTYNALLVRTDPLLIVQDADNPEEEGLWAFVNGNYEKQVNRDISTAL